MRHNGQTLRGGESTALPSTQVRFCRAAAVLLFLSTTAAHGWLYLKRIAFLPFGQRGSGNVVLMDSDQDSLGEMTYNGRWEAARKRTWEIAEYRPVNRFVVVRADTLVYPLPSEPRRGNFKPFDAADIDRDGLIEVVGEVSVSIGFTNVRAICSVEPSVPGHLADTFNWLYVDSASPVAELPRFVTDLDRDSLLEITTELQHRMSTAVFENAGDNRDSLVFCQPPIRPRVWGDFDQNGRMDLVIDHYEAEHIFECTGDNQFAEVCTVSSEPWTNQHDWFSGRDVDRNGRPEFFVVYYKYIGSKNYLCMFEAVAEHEYTRYLIDSIVYSGGDCWPVSICADLDGDGFEELVWAIDPVQRGRLQSERIQ
jgi:hypothetical protein